MTVLTWQPTARKLLDLLHTRFQHVLVVGELSESAPASLSKACNARAHHRTSAADSADAGEALATLRADAAHKA